MTLTTNEQHLVRVSTATATGNITALTKHLTAALDHGLEINKLKELLIQLYAYCGFPRSLNGLNALMSLVESRKAAGIQDEMGPEALEIPTNKSRFDLGDAVQQELTGAPVKGPLFDFAPAIDAFLKEHLFADIFLRGILTYREREIITIAALASLGVVSQLNSHIRIGMNTGLTREEITSIAYVLEHNNAIQAAGSIRTILDSI